MNAAEPAQPMVENASASTPLAIAEVLGARVAGLRFADLPVEALHWSRVALLDTIGVTLAGAQEPAVRALAGALAPGPGPALIMGSNRRAGILDAAHINGTAAHALDFDDCNNTVGGHPSVPILPGLLALAESRGASGRDVLLAYVAGFEALACVARGVNFHHYEKGWHPTATLGVFGGAAACARLLGLDAKRTAVALAIAASMAAGLKANFGTMVKPLHIGHCARDGLLAALLAAEGYSANAGIFEHPQGFLEVFNGAGHYDAARIVERFGEPYDIVEPGIAIKQYPCCGSTHPAIDSMLALVRERPIDPDQVERIEGWIHARRLRHTNRAQPGSNLDAKFSLQYCLSRALVDRCVVLEHFEGEAWRDHRIAQLLPRVKVAAYDAQRFDPANHFGGEVRVTLRDGTVRSARVEQALGRTSANPLPEDLLREKFMACAARALPAAQAATLADGLLGIDASGDVRATLALAGTAGANGR